MYVNNLMIRLKQRDADSIQEAKKVLQKLKGHIPVLLDSRVETDARGEEAKFDLMLINTFAELTDIEIYLKHPVHVEVGQYIVAAMETSASLCYEVEKRLESN